MDSDDSEDSPSDYAQPGGESSTSAGRPAGVGAEFEGHEDGSVDATELQQMLLATDTVQEFLGQLVERAAASTGCHCGITVGPADGQHDAYTVACSDDVGRQLDELQYAEGDGPCLQALRSAVPVFVTDMASETRWPEYMRHATSLGARASLSYPLLNAERSIGAINLYAFEPLAPQVDLQARASDLASAAAGALALALRLGERGDMIAHLRTALTSRSTIDQAIGILMAQQRCGPRAAFDLLRRASQSRNIKLRDVAAGIVAAVERNEPGAPSGRY